MIFKKLEMQGFKSFFDRTEICFRSGMNAVVGPNGCGKSNIADAIRWVLGEQSPKQLRGERMEDLIFSGSESRRPLGMAEVSLTVETNGADLPALYNKFTEVCVTRRLYRSGESEFFINNTPCRLRDIRELFLDTGMNPKAYAVIDQGDIGLIISSRPEDRRILVEEAAGIAKYKERKATALRKLESTQQNLLRLNDIIREVKRQISALNRQARKAEKYNRLQKEIEELELKILYQQHYSRQEESASQQERIQGLEELRETLRREIDSSEAAMESGRLALVETEKEVLAAREEFYSHRARLESVEHQFENRRSRVEQVRSTCSRSEAEVSRLSKVLNGLSEERSRLEEEIQEIKVRLIEKEDQQRGLSEELSRIREVVRTVKVRLENATSHFLDEVRKGGDVQNRVTQSETLRGSLEREIERLREESRLLEGEDNRHNLRESELSKKLAGKRQERAGVRNARAMFSRSLATARVELELIDQDLLLARENLSHSSSRLASLTELERNISGWPERFQEELNRILQHQKLNGEVRGILAGFVQVSPEHETAFEAVLGEKLKYLLVNSFETAIDAAHVLQSDSSVRGTLLPLQPRRSPAGVRPEGPDVLGEMREFVSIPPDYQNVIQHLLQDVILVKDLEAGVALWSAGPGQWTFVTPAGEVIRPDGSVTAGQLDTSHELLPLLRKIRESQTSAATAEERVGELTRQQEELKEHRAELETEEERLNEAGYRLDIEISSLEKDLSITRQKLHSDGEQRNRLDEEARRIVTEKEALEKKLVYELSCKSELEAGRRLREKEIVSLEEELSALITEQKSLEERFNSSQVELAAGRERSSHLLARRERISSDQAQTESQREELSRELLTLREEERQESERVEALSREKEELSGSREDLERLVAETQENHRHAAGRVNETEESLRQLRLKTEEVQQEVADLQVKQAELQVRLEHIQGRVAEIRNCAPEELWDRETREAVRQVPPEEIEQQHREQISQLQALGPVNLAAIGDHQELQERLEFLKGQHDDLEKASQDLHQAIRKINRTSRQRFVETFEKINEKFQEIFPVLFEQGQALLQLTDTEDPLEAGIEVLVQPAGKKLQQLLLLSGGEKALASLALLLAIFMVKPTPFCLLDEVDAPLDESNTSRFLHLLSKSINGSQLVVITHNKKTMENAQHLFGVTMSEPGVSTLISVQLRDQ